MYCFHNSLYSKLRACLIKAFIDIYRVKVYFLVFLDFWITVGCQWEKEKNGMRRRFFTSIGSNLAIHMDVELVEIGGRPMDIQWISCATRVRVIFFLLFLSWSSSL